MLVLSAAYKSKYFRSFISKDPKRTMKWLFGRTIKFLGSLKAISPTLGHDQFILQCLQDLLFEGDDDLPMIDATASSFGS